MNLYIVKQVQFQPPRPLRRRQAPLVILDKATFPLNTIIYQADQIESRYLTLEANCCSLVLRLLTGPHHSLNYDRSRSGLPKVPDYD